MDNESEVLRQWHPAFYSAIKLELRKNSNDLSYESERNVNSKPIQIDFLIIKKERDVIIDNEIGKIFRTHNIMEYKSPGDTVNIDTFLKVLAYAYLYKVQENHIDDIPLNELTATMSEKANQPNYFSS